ncbi:MAG: DUF378 domain-containing protein [Phycisphaerae bacterium]|nr:DUF378 domain-containing protein [Phycisphaerae bacterium]
MIKLHSIEWLCLVLVIMGGLNWGLVGFFGFDLVSAIFGLTMTSRILHAAFGLCALYLVIAMTILRPYTQHR